MAKYNCGNYGHGSAQPQQTCPEKIKLPRPMQIKEVPLSTVNAAEWISKLQECSYGQI